jgi:hypothetical protein
MRAGAYRVNLKIDFVFRGTDPDPLELRPYPCMFPGVPGFLIRTQPAHKLADKLYAMTEHRERNTRVADIWDLSWKLGAGRHS